MIAVKTPEIKLTIEQAFAHEEIIEFFKKKTARSLTLGGYAGTGKTTLIAQIVRTMTEKKKRPSFAFCCFTGKAAFVLRDKLEAAQALTLQDYCGTIHSLIYRPRTDKATGALRWSRTDSIDYDFLIVDEASMVNEVIWNDLLSYGKPILAVGDHGQLPPVSGEFNLMEKPAIKLATIQRQEKDNPIIKVSIMAREEGKIPFENFGGAVVKLRSTVAEIIPKLKSVDDALFLCGYNRTRTAVNQLIRSRLGFSKPEPMPKERVVCLKNNRDEMIFNGMMGTITTIETLKTDDRFYKAEIEMEDGTEFEGQVIKPQFGQEKTLRELDDLDVRDIKDLFDWGYCLTVHKAQGSEAKNVVLFEERFQQMDDEQWRRWLYTGVTRAREKLLIVG